MINEESGATDSSPTSTEKETDADGILLQVSSSGNKVPDIALEVRPDMMTRSRLTIVDLAGSERLKKTQAQVSGPLDIPPAKPAASHVPLPEPTFL